MRRVVVTGMGAVSCLGAGRKTLFDGLRAGRSGFRAMPDFAALGMRCQVAAPADTSALEPPPRKLRRYLPQAAEFAWHATIEALAEAGLDEARVRERDVGIVMGGAAALSEYEAGLDVFHAKGISRLSPFIVPRSMGSAVSATLTQAFGFGGRGFTVGSACTSATHAIGQAMELIQLGRQEVVVCGGAEELHDKAAMCFDVMNALSTTSVAGERVSTPYAADRDGILLGGGAGVMVLESLEHAQARGATILAEMAGYGAASDPDGMIGPAADGMAEAMHQAIDLAGILPGYVNTHACATVAGDLAEWEALRRVFGDLAGRNAVRDDHRRIAAGVARDPGRVADRQHLVDEGIGQLDRGAQARRHLVEQLDHFGRLVLEFVGHALAPLGLGAMDGIP